MYLWGHLCDILSFLLVYPLWGQFIPAFVMANKWQDILLIVLLFHLSSNALPDLFIQVSSALVSSQVKWQYNSPTFVNDFHFYSYHHSITADIHSLSCSLLPGVKESHRPLNRTSLFI